MSDRHVIRLRGPWWGSLCASGGVTDHDRGRFKTSCPFFRDDHVSDQFVGTLKLARSFNGSAGMLQATHVWLTISTLAVPAEICLNKKSLGLVSAESKIELLISPVLENFNQLDVVLMGAGEFSRWAEPSQPLLAGVAVEIGQ